MNIRDKFLTSQDYSFFQTDKKWNDSDIFCFEKFNSKDDRNLSLKENKVFLGLTDERMIYLDDLKLEKSDINPDFLIFASRHASKAAKPAILVHTTGNWSDDNTFGGEQQDLSNTSALMHKAGFLSLLEQTKFQQLVDFSVDIEVTHHGPTILEKPLIYIELGSSKEHWGNQKAARVVADSIINTIFKYLEYKKKKNIKVGLGYGGTHYGPNFNRLIQNKNVAMSFICPKYYVQNLDRELIEKMINHTSETVNYFIIDWKGTSSDDKKHLIPLLETFDIPIKKIKEIP